MNILIRSRQNSQHVSNSLPIYQVIKFGSNTPSRTDFASHSPPLLSHAPTPHDYAFPFKEIALNRMHRQIVSTIRGPHLFFCLPNPNQTSVTVPGTSSSRTPQEGTQRLDFLGDAWIGSAVSEQLCRYWPNECPRFYSDFLSESCS